MDQWDGNASSVRSFKTTTGINFPLLLTASPVATSYKTTYDRIVVIDKTGYVRFTGSQNVSSDLAAAKAIVEQYPLKLILGLVRSIGAIHVSKTGSLRCTIVDYLLYFRPFLIS